MKLTRITTNHVFFQRVMPEKDARQIDNIEYTLIKSECMGHEWVQKYGCIAQQSSFNILGGGAFTTFENEGNCWMEVF